MKRSLLAMVHEFHKLKRIVQNKPCIKQIDKLTIADECQYVKFVLQIFLAGFFQQFLFFIGKKMITLLIDFIQDIINTLLGNMWSFFIWRS